MTFLVLRDRASNDPIPARRRNRRFPTALLHRTMKHDATPKENQSHFR